MDAERQESRRLEKLLRPCAHCGPMPAMPEFVENYGRWQVFCGPCGSSSGSAKTREQAAYHWNSRYAGPPEFPHSGPGLRAIAVFISQMVPDLSIPAGMKPWGARTLVEQDRAHDVAAALIAAMNAWMADAAIREAEIASAAPTSDQE